MLKLFTPHSYQERVDNIYKQLKENVWCDIKSFELKVRKIHLLNQKIRRLSADMGRVEGKYDTL